MKKALVLERLLSVSDLDTLADVLALKTTDLNFPSQHGQFPRYTSQSALQNIALVSLYQAPIYRTLRCRGIQHADAMEVTQQVLVALVRYLPQYERDGKPASFRRWLNRIISNLCWKAWSSRQNPIASAIPSNNCEDNGYQELADQQQQEELRHDLEIQHYRHCFRLAAAQVKPLFTAMTWDAFWLSCVDGMLPTAVAEKLGMSAGAVYIARSRVIARLRDQVERMEAEGEL